MDEDGEYVKTALQWLKLHYPKEDSEMIDVRWSAVINFAKMLDNIERNN